MATWHAGLVVIGGGLVVPGLEPAPPLRHHSDGGPFAVPWDWQGASSNRCLVRARTP